MIASNQPWSPLSECTDTWHAFRVARGALQALAGLGPAPPIHCTTCSHCTPNCCCVVQSNLLQKATRHGRPCHIWQSALSGMT